MQQFIILNNIDLKQNLPSYEDADFAFEKK